MNEFTDLQLEHQLKDALEITSPATPHLHDTIHKRSSGDEKEKTNGISTKDYYSDNHTNNNKRTTVKNDGRKKNIDAFCVNIPIEENGNSGYLDFQTGYNQVKQVSDPSFSVGANMNVQPKDQEYENTLTISENIEVTSLTDIPIHSISKISYTENDRQISNYWLSSKTGKVFIMDSTSINTIEYDSEGLEDAYNQWSEPIIEFVRTKSRVCGIKNKSSVEVFKFSGNFDYSINLKDYLSIQDEYLVCSLADPSTDYLMLGSSEGTLIVLRLNVGNRAYSLVASNQEHLKRVNSLVWKSQAQLAFFSCSLDKTVHKYTVVQGDGCKLSSKFVYDQPIMRCCKSHDFLVIAFENGSVSIVEPTKGSILITMTNSETRAAESPERRGFVHWTQCVYSVSEEQAKGLAGKALYSRADFIKYLKVLKILIKFEEPSIKVLSYPKDHPDNLTLQLFTNPILAKMNRVVHVSNRVPILIEQLGTNILSLRYFVWTDSKKSSGNAMMMMIDCFISLKKEENQQHSTFTN